MTPEEEHLLIPADTDSGSHGGHHLGPLATCTFPEFSTFSFPEEWKPIYDLACEQNILAEFLLLVDVTRSNQNPLAFGRVLATVGSYWARRVLLLWEEQWPAAKTLLRLSYFISAAPEVVCRYKPLLDEVEARNQLAKGSLPANYLIALLIEGFPTVNAELLEWLQTLRIWVLGHAIERGALGNLHDRKLQMVADKLRLARRQNLADKLKSDRHPTDNRWTDLFGRLVVPVTGIESFEHDFLLSIATVLNVANDRPSFSSEQALLRALKAVANHEHAPVKPSNQDSLTLLQKTRLVLRDAVVNEHSVLPLIFSEEPDDEDSRTSLARVYAADGATSDVAAFKSDPSATDAEQRLHGNTVFLYAEEELQYLPWSWSRPNQHETERLNRWIASALHSVEIPESLLAAITWMCCASGRSFRRMLALPIGAQPGSDWALSSSGEALTRLPPRRIPGWVPGNHQKAWVSPEADHIQVSLPPDVRTCVQKCLAGRVNVTCIRDLWNSEWGEPEPALRKILATVAPRVTPGMLGGVLPQRAYLNTNDAAFVRLLISREGSGLTGACSYPSWSSREVLTILNGVSPEGGDYRDTATGSRLDPIESLLVEQIRGATLKLGALREGGNAIAFHNAYTAYTVTALLAATGARPIRDPFESWTHFDLKKLFVYIDDKASDSVHQGRLVPLPSTLADFIGTQYRQHLKHLAEFLNDRGPQLAKDVAELSLGGCPTNLPCFFLLADDNDAVVWESVSEASIESLGLWTWPLPLNLFRHRLASQLRRKRVDPELIDSVLGHSEGTCPTHGDFSFRTWSEDVNELRPILDDLYRSLGFADFKPWRLAEPGGKPPADHVVEEQPSRSFGEAARRAERKRRQEFATQLASQEIEDYLSGRTLDQLSEDEFDQLSRRMLFNASGLPSAMGNYKYRYLMAAAALAWEETGKRARIARRYVAVQGAASPFRCSACGAQDDFNEIKSEIEKIASTLRVSRFGVRDCAAYSAVFIAVVSRVSSLEIISSIVMGHGYRIVSLGDEHFLEYARGMDAKNYRGAVKRFKVTYRTAQLLDRVMPSNARVKTEKEVPRCVQGIAEVLIASKRLRRDANFGEFLSALCGLVDQVNVMKMPGILAAFLAERVDSYSVGWADWVRLKHGIAVDIQATDDDELSFDDVFDQDSRAFVSLDITDDEVQRKTLQSGAQDLFKEMSRVLGAHPSDKSFGSDDRSALYRKLRAVIDDREKSVSSGIYAFAQWVASLLWRSIGAKRYVALATVDRYFTELRASFESLGYGFDVLNADAEDVTELYSNILAWRKVDQRYTADRLYDFHRWARVNYGLDDPEWDELPVQPTRVTVSAGVFTETDYLKAFRILTEMAGRGVRSASAAAFLLFLCYRFALRSKEGFGLTREDWVKIDAVVSVLVRSNRYRNLKTKASRRQTPLVFNISSEEQLLIEKWLLALESIHGSDTTAPLFGVTPGTKSLLDMRQVKRLALYAVKRATGNRQTTIHHGRHSGVNYVAMRLVGTTPGLWKALCADESVNIRSLLLGHDRITRRTAWAVARYLGHARMTTTFRNYIHFLSDWADEIVRIDDAGGRRVPLKHAKVLDELPVIDVDDLSEPTVAADQPMTVYNLFPAIANSTSGSSFRSSASARTFSSDGGATSSRSILLK